MGIKIARGDGTYIEKEQGEESFGYIISDKQDLELSRRYRQIATKNNQPERYGFLIKRIGELSRDILRNIPPGLEQEKALDALDLVMMYSHTAMMRNE